MRAGGRCEEKRNRGGIVVATLTGPSLVRSRFWQRGGIQLGGGIVLAAAVPFSVAALLQPLLPSLNLFSVSLAGSVAGISFGYWMFRNLIAFPGIRASYYVLPVFSSTFATIFAVLFLFRLEYSRPLLVASFVIAVICQGRPVRCMRIRYSPANCRNRRRSSMRPRITRLTQRFGDLLSFSRIDFSDMRALDELASRFDFDRIIHLGAQAGVRYSMENPHAYGQSNLAGHLNILDWRGGAALRTSSTPPPRRSMAAMPRCPFASAIARIGRSRSMPPPSAPPS